jgi:hypothetical protein
LQRWRRRRPVGLLVRDLRIYHVQEVPFQQSGPWSWPTPHAMPGVIFGSVSFLLCRIVRPARSRGSHFERRVGHVQ